MPELPRGLYLLRQYSSAKGVYHFGILDVGNNLGYEMAREPVVVHLTSPTIRADWLSATEPWEFLERIADVQGAVTRIGRAMSHPCYDLVFNNCEHFARYVASGRRESRQVSNTLLLVGMVGAIALVVSGRAA